MDGTYLFEPGVKPHPLVCKYTVSSSFALGKTVCQGRNGAADRFPQDLKPVFTQIPCKERGATWRMSRPGLPDICRRECLVRLRGLESRV